MRLIYVLSALILMSCGVNRNRPDYGKTTQSELIALKGEPLSEDSIPIENSKILNYEDNERYQLTDGIVTGSLSTPKDSEMTFLYWQHAFKDCDTVIENIGKKKIGHEKNELYMRCDAMGVGVIYKEDSEIVLRVVEYAKK